MLEPGSPQSTKPYGLGKYQLAQHAYILSKDMSTSEYIIQNFIYYIIHTISITFIAILLVIFL